MATPHPSTASLRSGCHLPLKVKALSNIIAKKRREQDVRPTAKMVILYVCPLFRGKCYHKPRPWGEVAPLGDGEGQKNKMNNE